MITLIIKRITIKQIVEDTDEVTQGLCDRVSEGLDGLDWEGIIKSRVHVRDADAISVEVEE